VYRVAISPLFPPSCIYTPSCSRYMIEAVRRHGVVKGGLLGIARILRCTRLCYLGGPDPVPDTFSWKELRDSYTIFRKKHRWHHCDPHDLKTDHTSPGSPDEVKSPHGSIDTPSDLEKPLEKL
jgi:hypothetical protein